MLYMVYMGIILPDCLLGTQNCEESSVSQDDSQSDKPSSRPVTKIAFCGSLHDMSHKSKLLAS